MLQRRQLIRYLIAGAGLAVAGPPAIGQDRPGDAIGRFHAAQRRLAKLLEDVKDKAAAEAAVPKVGEAVTELNTAKAALKQMRLDSGKTEHAEDVKSRQNEAQESSLALQRQLGRISANPLLNRILGPVLAKLQ
jgi:hypothetical protein